MALFSFNILLGGVLALVLLQIQVQAVPHSQVSKVKFLLKSEERFCRKLLNGQMPGVSTVTDTVQTTLPVFTRTVKTRSVTTDATVTGTATAYVYDYEISTDVEDITFTSYTATATDFVTTTTTRTRDYEKVGKHHTTSYLNRRGREIKKSDYPKNVQKYSDSIVVDACYLILYGTLPETSITATTTKTVTSRSRPMTTSTITQIIDRTATATNTVTSTLTKSFTKHVTDSSVTDTITAAGTTTITSPIATVTATKLKQVYNHH